MAAGRGGLGLGAAWKAVLGRRPEGIAPTQWARQKFTRSRIPASVRCALLEEAESHGIVFQPRPEDHEKYGGDPEQPHKVHIITRIKSVIGRPYWEKKIIHDLGLDKVLKWWLFILTT
ncbi:hypothetical protein CIB84_003733 [Bambusicola thoracicus]|uniref:Large ribosomal subunit protein uL30m n=1 Tax=Bambusicola thoracicus TaxID=9083 RepID=A0A2P4T827_BAMTH|nr:hypothetical protein CIB84_003733 [Bambusicola thoracicus]